MAMQGRLSHLVHIAPGKRGYTDVFSSYFSTKTYVVCSSEARGASN